MLLGKKTHILIAAAGSGSRMGANVNKQFLHVAGQAIIVHTVERCASFMQSLEPDERGGIIIITSQTEMQVMEQLMLEAGLDNKILAYVPGGKSRQESVSLGLQYLSKINCQENDLVMIHDGARCLASVELFQNCRNAAQQYGASCPGIPVHDTLRRAFSHSGQNPVLFETVSRDLLFAMQTPQSFHFGDILEAHRQAKIKIDSGELAAERFTDDVSVAQEAGLEVRLVEGERTNIKLTKPEDMNYAEYLLQSPKETK